MTFPQTVNIDSVLANPDSLLWVAHDSHGRHGSRIHILFKCEASGQLVGLVHSKPGAFAHEHVHEGHETILVLQGSFQDEAGRYKQGDLIVYQPGSRHSWNSPEGALIYVVWGGRVSSVADVG